MTSITHLARRIYDRWKRDTLGQSDFRPSVSILKLSLMAVFVGVAATVVAWLLYRMIGFVTNLAFSCSGWRSISCRRRKAIRAGRSWWRRSWAAWSSA